MIKAPPILSPYLGEENVEVILLYGKEKQQKVFFKETETNISGDTLESRKNESGIHICDIETYTVLEKKKTLQRTI